MKTNSYLSKLAPAITLAILISSPSAQAQEVTDTVATPQTLTPNEQHHKYHQMTDITKIYHQYGMVDEAKLQAKETLDFIETNLPIPRYLAATLNRMGFINHANGDYAEAKKLYHKALDIRVKTFGMMHQDTAKTLSNMGILYQALGQFDKAEYYYTQALNAVTLIQGKYTQDNAIILENLKTVFEKTNDEGGKKTAEFHLADIYKVIRTEYEIDI